MLLLASQPRMGLLASTLRDLRGARDIDFADSVDTIDGGGAYATLLLVSATTLVVIGPTSALDLSRRSVSVQRTFAGALGATLGLLLVDVCLPTLPSSGAALLLRVVAIGWLSSVVATLLATRRGGAGAETMFATQFTLAALFAVVQVVIVRVCMCVYVCMFR